MAELLVANGMPSGNALAAYLGTALTEDYVVVSEPDVRGQPMDVVVVGPGGLCVLHAKDWQGEVMPSQRGAWSERLPDGRQIAHPHPGKETAAATRALRAFLADAQWPANMPIRHVVVFTDGGTTVSGAGVAGIDVVHMDDVLGTVMASEAAPADSLANGEDRLALADALAEGRLGMNERTPDPFVFRTSGFLGLRRKVWTVREAIRHMDRNPEDGIAHLRNGTLVRWLEEHNAEHLAAAARQCMREHPNDMRAALEAFLVGFGQVARPRLNAFPRKIRLGYVLSGQSVRTELRLRRGRGRGYLYGRVEPRDNWVRVTPSGLERGVLLATVSAETESLLIQPYRTAIDVVSSASEEPIPIPLHLQVMPQPSRVNRALLRPLSGALFAGILGILIGWAAARVGLAAPSLGPLPPISAAVFWPAAVGLAWFVLGAIRGARQAPAWPITYALLRWFLRTLFWAVAIAGLAVLVLWSGEQLAAQTDATIVRSTYLLVLTLALASAALPGTVGEVQSSRAASEGNLDSLSRLAQRPSMLGAMGLVLVLVAIVGVQAFDLARRAYLESPFVGQAQEWIAENWVAWEEDLGDTVNGLLRRYYEERAR